MNITPFLCFIQFLWSIPNLPIFKSTNASRFKVRSLPDSPTLPASWAGRLPVPGRKDGNEIFFWLFEAENKSYDDTFIIWFNGGPGCSSLVGLTGGNGPISFEGNSTSLERNPYSWTQLGHVLYVDQPVGTGFSTASYPYPVTNNEMITADFVAWLNDFFTYFPHLQSKKIHLMGESYAGIYIPYFTAALMESNTSHPLDIRSMSLGDGSWGNAAAMSSAGMGAYMRSQATALKLPKDILAAFTAADQTCGFDDVLAQAQVYPPKGKIDIPGNPENFNYRRRRRDMTDVLNSSCSISPKTVADVNESIFNSTCYGPCATYSTAMDYVDTASAAGTGIPCFDVYDIHHDCSTIETLTLMAEYFSRADVQAALHVSSRGTYSSCNSTILGTLLGAPSVVPPAYSILPNLVTEHNISLHIYNGEWDMLLNHIGTELSIQNMTWRGAQGFSAKPQQLFYVDDAMPVGSSAGSGSGGRNTTTKVAGNWAEERGVSYHLFRGAGHSVFANKPREMFAYVRDVVVRTKKD
ncbi:Carboxypeptidase [Penicillium cataractarum]|uniref:Carboxypeptidase n=1 Tax=Penicillium cataractarum TaxID=2100454 RepID=A0A9W9RXS5_9EURO|nr:Carboxypeptidase [Penicillium cataractarum]KAJ5368326.1 Carboxypeptidase [Penicillium cataractarum]